MKKTLRILTILLGLLAVCYVAAIAYFHFSYPQDKWNWSEIDTSQSSFSKDFIWGTATAAHQIEGDNENTNWGEWEEKSRQMKHPIIKNGDVSGKAVDGWNLAISDIKLMKELGVNSYRFSLAWNKIEPERGQINEDALKHYDNLINELKANGIEPMITLHHFTHPIWFEQLGQFEKEENIRYFVEFSKLVFTRYHDRVKYWVTLNEPNVFVTSAYFNTPFPPGKADSKLGAEVLKNMLKAHVEVYLELKKIENETAGMRDGDKNPTIGTGSDSDSTNSKSKITNPKSQIGLATSIFQFEPARRWHLAHNGLTRYRLRAD